MDTARQSFFMIKKFLALFTFAASSFSTVIAQQYRPAASAEIYRELQQLNVLGTVMYVAAHPDDENTRLLSYLVHHDHVRTIYLSLTRGDGGQNILGNEQGSTLGLIRNYELMEARKIDGAEQIFTNVIDFGYTKSPEETFNFWDKKELSGLVQKAYETYKPDVIICRFPTTGEGGHGQHTVSAIVAGEAFNMAKKQSGSWLPKRLLFNSFRFGDRNTTSEDQFKISINQYDPLLGEGYGEMAGRSRSVHKSQGAGTPQSVGIAIEYFKFLDGVAPEQSLYDGVDMSWNRVQQPEIGKKIEGIILAFDFRNPSASVPPLVAIRKEIKIKVTDKFWKQQKLKEIDDIILSCAGVMAELVTDKPETTPGGTLDFNLNVIARYNNGLKLEKINWPVTTFKTDFSATQLQSDSLYKYPVTLTINKSEALTEPYWLQEPAGTSKYNYNSVHESMPEACNDLSALAEVRIEGELFQIPIPLSYKKLDPVRGDVVQRLRIVPAISVKPFNTLFIFDKDENKTTWVKLNAFENAANVQLKAYLNGEEIAATTVGNIAAGRDTLVPIEVPTKNINGTNDKTFLLFAAEVDGRSYSRSRELIQYQHIPELQYFNGAWMKAVRKDWTATVKKVGYIDGAGDYVADILNLTGVNVERIPANAMSSLAYLSNYEAIVIGVRAFNTQSAMASWMPVLLRYVENGGNLVVQYNTSQGLLSNQLGPYPISLSRDRVTEENAVVTVTDKTSPILNYPNKITNKDFENWVQERGIYYPGTFDNKYQTMISMHDTGEKDLNSAILHTPYGKGNFVYTSLVFFRQLPAGNTGAIKLLMNMISAGK